MIVYLTTNLINNKQYVGQTNGNRSNYLGGGILLRNAINKYGRESFKKTVLVKCSSQEELDKQEIFWIKKLNTLNPKGYNIALGGNGRGMHSNETRKKMSINNIGFKGRQHSEESKEQIRLKSIGRKHSKETRQKMSNFQMGRILSEEHKRKIGDAEIGNRYCIGRKLSKKTKSKISKSVKKYWKNKRGVVNE